MDIGRAQRRFTAEPVESPVPGTPEAPVEHLEQVERLEQGSTSEQDGTPAAARLRP